MTNSVCIDQAGVIWIGTQSGLNRLDPGSGTFTRYSERDGLAGNNVSKILEDDTGDLWLSTSKGLSRFDPRKNIFKNYYISDGLAGNEFYNYASAFKSPTGEMFFSSYAGVTSFPARRCRQSICSSSCHYGFESLWKVSADRRQFPVKQVGSLHGLGKAFTQPEPRIPAVFSSELHESGREPLSLPARRTRPGLERIR